MASEPDSTKRESKSKTMDSIKYAVICFLKGLVCSILLIIGLIIGGIVAAIVGLKQPTMPKSFDTTLAVLLMIPAGIMIAITLGELFKKFNQSYREKVVCLFLFNYTIYYFLQVLEQIIFSTMMDLSYGLVSDIFPSLFISLAVAKFWKSKGEDSKIRIEIKNFFKKRKTLDWAWRLLLAWLVYVPIYYFVGSAISPWVLPYYSGSNLDFGLVLPDTMTMIGMQFIRGAFYLLASLIVIILWKESKRYLQLWLGFSIFIQIAVIPLIVGYWLPLELRFFHAIELTTDSFLQAIIYVELLFNKR